MPPRSPGRARLRAERSEQRDSNPHDQFGGLTSYRWTMLARRDRVEPAGLEPASLGCGPRSLPLKYDPMSPGTVRLRRSWLRSSAQAVDLSTHGPSWIGAVLDSHQRIACGACGGERSWWNRRDSNPHPPDAIRRVSPLKYDPGGVDGRSPVPSALSRGIEPLSSRRQRDRDPVASESRCRAADTPGGERASSLEWASHWLCRCFRSMPLPIGRPGRALCASPRVRAARLRAPGRIRTSSFLLVGLARTSEGGLSWDRTTLGRFSDGCYH